jgi:hypothetical protein
MGFVALFKGVEAARKQQRGIIRSDKFVST